MSNYVEYGDHVYFKNDDTNPGGATQKEMYTLTSVSGANKPKDSQYYLYFAINKF